MPGTAMGGRTVTAGTAGTAGTARPASTVEEVVGRLREIGAGLPPADGVAVFNRLYLDVTEAVRDGLGAGYFTDPPTMAELDVVFAGRYLRAVAADTAGQEPPACWQPLFALRTHPGVHPLQFALAGMNAHIQHDLPLAVIDTCRRRGCAPADMEEDYHRINEVLAAVETAVREQLMPGLDLLECAEPLTHLLSAWSVEAAREGAWSAVRALWELRHLPGAAQAFATALDCSVGLLGRALLVPLGTSGPRHPSGHRPGRRSDHPTDHWSGDPTGLAPGGPGTAPAGRLPEARNRPAGGSAGADARAAEAGAASAAPAHAGAADTGTADASAADAGDQAQLECSGLPSA
ncbi:hypothetical protein BX285_3654 [Streptomyces sp. 1114.5]|uniref:DUF5995 family protein n=1 Tax=Streptomyces sp. 1114.5 TaxID=1938830 RepID=UPI000F1A678F|nr:DUF5995 family protein [Streptomyces sp. 1114.5]RKT19199.1 hypothetical protein BX285_3654 [Streptomyces sp. 1114.5]